MIISTYRDIVLRCIFLTILLFFVVSKSTAQTIRVEAANTSVAVGEGLLVSVIVDMANRPAAGVSASIRLGNGIQLLGTGVDEIEYGEKWFIGIEPKIGADNIMKVAAAIGPGEEPCDDECVLVRFAVKSSTPGTKEISIDLSGTKAVTPSDQPQSFLSTTGITIQFGSGNSLPGDTTPDGEITDPEAITAIVNWLAGINGALSDVDAITLITLWLRGGCYQSTENGFESVTCTN